MTGDASDDNGAAPSPRRDRSQPVRPKDAATLIVVDTGGRVPKVLMGRRRDDLAFMPGKYVFPGGSVDAADRQLAGAYQLDADECAKLLLEMKGEPSVNRATALALAAIRETFEEAGLVIGSPAPANGPSAASLRDDAWRPFLSEGYVPRPSAVRFFARAITPPGRPRRFDTRFFWSNASDIAHAVETRDGELSGLHWLTVEEARAMDVPTITRVVLDDLMDHFAAGSSAGDALVVKGGVPFYHYRNGTFRRDILRLG